MLTLFRNKIMFKGQYAVAYNKLCKGHTITLEDFSNGSWEATTQMKRFIELLDKSKFKYKKFGASLRTYILLKEE